MGSEIASSSATQTEPKRPLMPKNLLKAAIEGNRTDMTQLLGLNNEQPSPHTNVVVEDGAPTELSESDLLRSVAGMEDTILHILSANGHENLMCAICMKDSSLLKAHNVRNETPFHHAARYGHVNTILRLMANANLEFGEAGLKELLRQKNCLGETTLHEAVRHGHGAIVSILMRANLKLAGLVNNDFVSPLYLATARGSLDMVQNMVEKMLGQEITPAFYSGPKQQTALHAAVLQNPELTGELLQLYSEPLGKGADETGKTPLHFVASTGNHYIAKLLLDKDRSLAYIQDSDGSFPVHTAVRMGHVKMITLLLERCPDSGQLLDGNGRNFLHIAIEANKSDVIFKLLNDLVNNLPISHWKKMFGRMANTMDNKGNTPLHLAAEHGYVTVMHYLLKNNELDLTLQNKEGQKASDLSSTGLPSVLPVMPNNLLKAAIEGNETDLRQLLGLNDNQEDHPPHTMVSVEDITPMEPSDCLRSIAGMEDTILHILSANGHGNLVCAICKKDSSLLRACNVRKETPFHHAARFGHLYTIFELIGHAEKKFGEAGLKKLLRQKNCLEETALHEAARHGDAAVVSALMEEDLELAGLVNNDYVSPLYLATARGSLDIVHNMVQNMVAKMSNQEITPAFYSGPKKQTALHAAVLQNRELTEELLQLYTEPLGKWADETGRNPFHFVASTGNHKIAELLLNKDPSLAYIKDSNGSFPVHTAARMGHVKMITLLLEKYPDSGQLLDGNGRNFLHIAIEAKKLSVFITTVPRWFTIMVNIMTIGMVNTTDILEDGYPTSHWKKMFNTMLNTMDNKGNTLLHLAAEHGYISFMNSLLKNNKLGRTLQNKEGLTAIDISLIQQRKSATNTKSRDLLGEFYDGNEGARFSTGLFQYYTKGQMSEKDTIQEHSSTTEKREAKMSSESVIAKAQLVGLGSVLIATVTFAAAFTLPGGTDQDTGPDRTYNIKAFFLADFSAFFLSFLSTMVLIYSSTDEYSDRMEMHVAKSMTLFSIAAKCMVIALINGVSLVLGPVDKMTAILLLIISLSGFLLFFDKPNGIWIYFRTYKVRIQLLNYITDGASGAQPKSITYQYKNSACTEFRYFFFNNFVPFVAPMIFINLLALLL